MIPLGCRTYLNAKADRDGSMFEKAGCSETIEGHARRDPDGMVKAELPEPQWAKLQVPRLDTMVNVQCPREDDTDMLYHSTRSRELGWSSPISRPRTGSLQPS